MNAPHVQYQQFFSDTLEAMKAKVKVKLGPSPLRLLGNQASDLALHGVLDVSGGVEAYGSVVGGADHLTLVIDVCRGDERLRSAVVSHADRFVFLRGAERVRRIKEAVTLWKYHLGSKPAVLLLG